MNMSKLEGTEVYEADSDSPFGKIAGYCLSEKNGCVDALIVETLSLIPMKKAIEFKQIKKATKHKIEITDKDGPDFLESVKCGRLKSKDIIGVKSGDEKPRKIKDIRFDFETGIISEIVVKRNIFKKNEILHVNKIDIKDNTIYIE